MHERTRLTYVRKNEQTSHVRIYLCIYIHIQNYRWGRRKSAHDFWCTLADTNGSQVGHPPSLACTRSLSLSLDLSRSLSLSLALSLALSRSLSRSLSLARARNFWCKLADKNAWQAFIFSRIQEPYLCPKEPYLLSKEPYIPSKEPNIVVKKPYLLSKESYVLSKKPCITTFRRRCIPPRSFALSCKLTDNRPLLMIHRTLLIIHR